MVIFKKAHDIKVYLDTKKGKNDHIGFIPTMGALHAGHVSLIRAAVDNGDFVVCSIFVNPSQFNEKSDFDKYPVTQEADIRMLIDAGCDVLFMPSTDEVYPGGYEKHTPVDFGYLDTILEGALRPGHFQGVGQVVGLLLDIISPERLYLGQKDYQQCLVIKKLLDERGNAEGPELIICPTKREEDGLAMSSRNARLTEPQRALAAVIYQCLVSIQSKQHLDRFQLVCKECIDLLEKKGLKPEYVSLADAETLEIIEDYDPSRKMVALIAARIGDVRLIDNLVIN
ncbi:MAG: pantoate--beta-alanine ligase [Sphingobacteriales bacterium]|nr:MAG: pantoate--beta-alanine ligase [Sphingobacteriales bacterium]